tara:strand:- start:8384 stop:9613 length:1230 start_codon:yes stop_codon:yes gene_type:complete
MAKRNLKTEKQCRISNNKKFKILDLGLQPLANSLKKKPKLKEKKFRLSLSYCKKSKLLQLDQTINKKLLFDSYVWVTGTAKLTKEYAEDFCNIVIRKTNLKKNDLILEIASNDGTFLIPFIKKGFKKVIGVDPAKNIAKIANKNQIQTINDYWNFNFSKKINTKYGKSKLIFARNVIPHVSDLDSVIRGIQNSLDNDGVGAIEFHDATEIYRGLQYDSIYHEHLCYFSLNSFNFLIEKYNLFSFDVIKSPINAGNKLVFFSKNKIKHTNNYKKQLQIEKKYKINNLNTWMQFSKNCINHKKNFRKLMAKLKNKKIIGYGSSARSQTFLNYANINFKYIRAIIDNNPLKQKLYTPGTNIPIVDFKTGISLEPDYIIILAWNFRKEIVNSCRENGYKNKFIIPFPNKISIL